MMLYGMDGWIDIWKMLLRDSIVVVVDSEHKSCSYYVDYVIFFYLSPFPMEATASACCFTITMMVILSTHLSFSPLSCLLIY